MTKTILITLIVIAVLAAGGLAWAKRGGHCSAEGRMQHMTERLAHKLDLSEEQQGHLQAFAEQLRETRGQHRAQRAQTGPEVEALLAEPTLDRERAVALIDRRLASMDDAKRNLVDAFATFSDSLAPAQRTQLAEMIGTRMAHRRGGWRWAH